MKKILLLFILISSQLFYSQSDCISAIPVCGNSNVSFTPSGPGNVLEDLGGCLTDDENFSVWYSFTVATAGTLAFTIDANINTTDYDFAVYAANATCAALGPPIRCNFAGSSPTGNTGLELVDSGSNYFEPYLDVTPGQTYYLVIDNFSNQANAGFSLIWEGTATLTSPFNNPTLTPNPFITPGVPNATNPALPNEILKCALPMQFDFTTLSTGILNGNQNFTVTYHDTANNAITGDMPLTTTLVNGTTIYYYRLKYQDPANPTNPVNGCFLTGQFKFKQGNIVANNATLTACNFNGSGTGVFNLNSATVFGDPTAIKKYYLSMSDLNNNLNPIANPVGFTSVAPRIIYVKVTSLEGCSANAQISLQFLPPLPVNNVTIASCNNNGAGTATYDLNSANVYSTGTFTKKYYLSMADLTAGTNEITNPGTYTSTQKKVYVKVTNADGCTGNGEITLQFYPVVTVNNATLESCFITTGITTAKFDLSTAVVTSQSPVTKKYYLSIADALAGINEIVNFNDYTSTSKDVYVKVSNSDSCFAIAKITLKVLPPVKSSILKNKTICLEDRTTLDAGPGFASYEWSTGATTPSITGVPVGAYWVILKTGKCFTLQEVNVYASNSPVISSLDINNNTITVNANGGTPAYQYSLNGTDWQTSNVFTGLPRGENTVFIKDSYDCEPVSVTVTVPNLVNAITPNGDNVNDVVDYSALAYKKNLVFTVYNRYGNKIFEADKIRNYKWDGTSGGKKIETGTYWYTITWTEDDKNSTQTKYNGWILVKNRE